MGESVQKHRPALIRQGLALTLSLNLLMSSVLGVAVSSRTVLARTDGESPPGGDIERPGSALPVLPAAPAFPFQLGKRALQLQGAVLDALPHVLMALDAYHGGDRLGTFRELETALDTLQAAQLPDGEAGLRLLEAQLPPGYEDRNLIQIYRETSRAAPERVLASTEADPSVLGGPQGMGSLGAPVPDDAPPPLPARGEAAEAPDQTRYLTEPEQAHVREAIDTLVAAFGEEEYPHSELFEQQVAYFIHQYQTELRGFFERSLIRSVKYMPMVKEILAERGVPETMAYIAFVESGFRPNAVSSVGATGLWQFMPKTAKGYGLLIDKTTDERLDPEKATIAAREYFLDLVAIFGSSSFLLAIASYNAGEGKVQYCLKQVENPFTQRTFWDIRPCLRRETREYIPRIIAAAIAAEAPEVFGFTKVLAFKDPSRYEVVTIPFSVALADLARLAGVSVETLKQLNPDLNPKDVSTPKSVTSYRLLVPAGRGEAIGAELSAMALRQAEADSRAREEAERKQRPPTPAPVAAEPSREDGYQPDGDGASGRPAPSGTPSALPTRPGTAAPETLPPEEPGEIQSEDEDIGRPTALDLLDAPLSSASSPTQAEVGARADSRSQPPRMAPTPLPREARGVMLRYRVRPGNNLFQIARDFGKTTQELRIWNPFLQARGLWPEDVLEIRELPEGSLRIEHQAREGELIDDIASLLGIPADRIKEWNGLRSDLLSSDTLLVVYRLGIPPEQEIPPEATDAAPEEPTTTLSSVPAPRSERRPVPAPEAQKDAEKDSAASARATPPGESGGGVPKELLATLARAQSGRSGTSSVPKAEKPAVASTPLEQGTARTAQKPLASRTDSVRSEPSPRADSATTQGASVPAGGRAALKRAAGTEAKGKTFVGPPAPSPETLAAKAQPVPDRLKRPGDSTEGKLASSDPGKTRGKGKPQTPEPIQYEVRRGNTLTQIADIFNVTISDIQAWNRLRTDRIREGQSLVLHPDKSITSQRYVVKKGDTLPRVARKFKLDQAHIRATNGLGSSDELTTGQVLVLYHGTRPAGKITVRKD